MPKVNTYALLDSYSQGKFILNWLTNFLEISRRNTSFTINTINEEFTSNPKALGAIAVASISKNKNAWMFLMRTFTIPEASVNNGDITKPFQLRKWKYLENAVSRLTFTNNVSVRLSIRAKCTKALEPIEILESRSGGF